MCRSHPTEYIPLPCRVVDLQVVARPPGCRPPRSGAGAAWRIQLWAILPADTTPGQATVITEPARNAWVPVAAWLRRQGALVVLVPSEQSADLRACYAKHIQSFHDTTSTAGALLTGDLGLWHT